jgi:hypothetical protein
MLTKYEYELLDYFRNCSYEFVEHLSQIEQTDIIVIDDLLPHLIAFLDKTIRLEIDFYNEGSIGYHKLLDILIEAHRIKPNEEMYNQLRDEFYNAFKDK